MLRRHLASAPYTGSRAHNRLAHKGISNESPGTDDAGTVQDRTGPDNSVRPNQDVFPHHRAWMHLSLVAWSVCVFTEIGGEFLQWLPRPL
jgi:hypothetical protein